VLSRSKMRRERCLRQVNKSLQKSVIGKMQLLAEMIRAFNKNRRKVCGWENSASRQVLKASV